VEPATTVKDDDTIFVQYRGCVFSNRNAPGTDELRQSIDLSLDKLRQHGAGRDIFRLGPTSRSRAHSRWDLSCGGEKRPSQEGDGNASNDGSYPRCPVMTPVMMSCKSDTRRAPFKLSLRESLNSSMRGATIMTTGYNRLPEPDQTRSESEVLRTGLESSQWSASVPSEQP
jgi:hypothetical protein